MTALRGDLSKISDLKRNLRELPRTVAADVASRASPALTDLTREAYSSGRTVYGDARPMGVNGNPLTLRKTGAVEGQTRFVAIGTIVRCALGPRYARYLIGRYRILPNGAMPAAWRERLRTLVAETKPVL